MKQVDEKTAIALFESGWWRNLSTEKIVEFQLFQTRLCMPFSKFHAAIETALGRPVFAHEFGLNIEGIRREFLGEKSAPSMDEILGLIPEDKRIVISFETEDN